MDNYEQNYFRDISKLAEPSFKEFKTTNYIKSTLEKLGVKEYRKFETGLFGTINVGSKRTIAIRADIDALPYDLKKNRFKHLCGHNLHTSALLSIIHKISIGEIKPKSNLRFIFQPAEEVISGAKFMIEQGCMEKVDEIYALHVDPEIEFGIVGIKTGAVMAGSTHFNIKLLGKGTHAAYPHKGNDLIVSASQFILSSQTIVSRKIDPVKPAVLSFGKIEGGTAANILPHTLTIDGTYRYIDDETKKILEDALTTNLQALSKQFDIRYKLSINDGTYPVINDNKLIKKVKDIFLINSIKLDENTKLSMGGEDFCFYGKYAPSLFLRLGIRKGVTYPLHHPKFSVPIDALLPAIKIWRAILENE